MVRFMKKKSGNATRKKVALILKDVLEDFVSFDEAFHKATKSQKSIKLSKKDVHNELNIVELIILSKLEKSKSEIRRLIKGNAIKLDDQLITDEKLIIFNELFHNGYLKLSIGKKRHIKIECYNFK